jgi:hypothetical protein
MKKTLFSLLFLTVIGITATRATELNSTTNAEYVVNDENIELLFATSTDATNQVASSITLSEGTQNFSNNQLYFKSGGGKSAVLAIVLDLFVGGLGLHRAYLGTKTLTWVGYILTFGGIGGIVPFVDLVVLIVNAGDISRYENNSKFFMW